MVLGHFLNLLISLAGKTIVKMKIQCLGFGNNLLRVLRENFFFIQLEM